jgi:hypothetical protein
VLELSRNTDAKIAISVKMIKTVAIRRFSFNLEGKFLGMKQNVWERRELMERMSWAWKWKTIAWGLIGTFWLVSCSGVSSPGTAPPPDAVPNTPAPGTAGFEALPNMSSGLSQLYHTWQSGEPVTETAQRLGIELSGERAFVTLVLLDEAAAQAAIAAIPELGGEVSSSFETMIDAWVPISALEQVAGLPGISLVREAVLANPVQSP